MQESDEVGNGADHGGRKRGLSLPWQSYMIPGVFFVAIGIGLINVVGAGPLSFGIAIAGLFLLLAAVLQAQADRQTGSGEGEAGGRRSRSIHDRTDAGTGGPHARGGPDAP